MHDVHHQSISYRDPQEALSTHCNPLWPVLTSQPPKEIEYCWPVRWTRGMRVGFHTISWKISFTSPFVKGFVKLPDHWSKDFKYFTCHVSKQNQTTLKRTNLPSLLEKGTSSSNIPWVGICYSRSPWGYSHCPVESLQLRWIHGQRACMTCM